MLGRLVRTSSKSMKLPTLPQQRCRFDQNCHHFQKSMDRSKKTTESTTVNSMDSFSVRCRQKQRDHQLRHFISWLGKMARCSRSKRTMDWCMSMTSTAICNDQSSISHVRRHRGFRYFHRHQERLYSSGHRISMTHPVRATTVSTPSNSCGFTKARTGPSSLSSMIRFRTLLGLAVVRSSSCFQDSSLVLPRCTMPKVSQLSSLPSGSEIQ